VPYGPGGISDVLARLTADRMTRMFGQPFVIENHGLRDLLQFRATRCK
jgi:tripartite-type tricarboxylate transporter receptor subunit TctC